MRLVLEHYKYEEHGGPVKPPDTGFLFVASYDSQGYGGSIRPRLHTGFSTDLPPTCMKPM
jgi:hypothetical protein